MGLLMTRPSLQSASVTVACSTIYTVSNSRNSMFSPSALAFSAYKSQEEEVFPTVAAPSSKIFVPMNNKKRHLRIMNWTADLFNDSRYCLFVCYFIVVEF